MPPHPSSTATDDNSTNERTPLLPSGRVSDIQQARSTLSGSIQHALAGAHDSAAVAGARAEVDIGVESTHTEASIIPKVITPLPMKQLLAIMLLFASQPIAFELVMPFVSESWSF
jgi:hypothetical protein